MKKIKVLHAIRQGKVGGGESHVIDLVSHIDTVRFESFVLSFTNGPMVDTLREMNIPVFVIHTEKPFDIFVWKKVQKLIQQQGIDIVHAHGTRALSNLHKAAVNLQLPLVYTVHGWSFHPDQPYVIRRIREISEKYLTAKADRTICVSGSNQKDGIQRLNLKRSVVIYNAVNLKKFNPDLQGNDIRKELGINPEAWVVGYIVRMTKQKDPITMLKAIQRVVQIHPDTILLMVGNGELKEKAIKMADKLDINKHVIFQPFRKDIPDILKAIDTYCLPSLWEGFPIGILEAMAMKVPVIATPVDGSTEMIKNRETGLLVPAADIDGFAEAIMQLKEDKLIRNNIIANGRKFVTSNFGINRLANEVETLYYEVMFRRQYYYMGKPSSGLVSNYSN